MQRIRIKIVSQAGNDGLPKRGLRLLKGNFKYLTARFFALFAKNFAFFAVKPNKKDQGLWPWSFEYIKGFCFLFKVVNHTINNGCQRS